MANSLQLNQSNPVAGLGTFTYTTVSAGFITVAVQSNIPRDPGSQLNSAQASPYASALQIVINQNGSPLVTIGGSSTNPTQYQPSLGTSARIQAASGDVITVVLSSANAIDNQPNTVKSSINIYQGE